MNAESLLPVLGYIERASKAFRASAPGDTLAGPTRAITGIRRNYLVVNKMRLQRA
jgi:hypothetical protein